MGSTDTPLRGIIFDMDGVLCDSEAFICEAAREMFRRDYGATVPAGDFVPFVGAGEDRYIGGPAEVHGIPITMPAAKDRTYAIYLELIRGRLQPLAGAVDFIRRARSAGLALAVASAADRVKVEGNLAEIGVPASDFVAVITGSDVARKKPHPDGFLAAAAALALPGEQCLVVEDAINGCRAGVAAGATVLGLTTSFAAAALREAGASHVAADLDSVGAELQHQLGMA